MLIAEDKSKTLKVRAEAGKDARLYAAVPYRAWRDERLKTPELRVLIAICGFLAPGGQVAKASQTWIADQLGVAHSYIFRFVKRLEHFGYLVLLEKKIVGVLPTIYGVVFNEKNPPTREDVKYLKQDIEQLPKKEAVIPEDQHIMHNAVQVSDLLIVWRKLVGNAYSSSEGLEDRHWAELSRGGMTCEMLASLHLQPGRTLIGFYMAEARRMLGVVS